MLIVKPLLIVAMGIAGATLGILTVQPWHFVSLPTGTSTLQGCNSLSGYVSIILDSSGFNDSGPRFPVLLHYKVGETVNLLVCNLDKVDAHGFAIDHYFDAGVTLRPGQAYKISFVANDAGGFLIYCNVLCPVHDFMRAKFLVTQ